MKKKVIKILYTLTSLDSGGTDRVIFNYACHMGKGVQTDFLVNTTKIGCLEEELEKRGSKVYHIPPLRESLIGYLKGIHDVIKNGGYDIVHVNQGYLGLFYLFTAARWHVPVRIVHSHNSKIPENKISFLKRKCLTVIDKMLATDLFACGIQAGEWMWGKRGIKNGNIYIMTNAIETNDFMFDAKKRERVRDELGINNKLVIGHVGRLTYQKNDEFILGVFSVLLSRHPESILIMIGEGELKNDVNKMAAELKISDKVLFLGKRTDVNVLLNAFDVFLLPSRYEGLPMVLVEAQVNGLPCFISDNITKELSISKDTFYLQLSSGESYWADFILDNFKSRKLSYIDIEEYDIEFCSRKLKDYYNRRLISENEKLQTKSRY